LVDVRYTPVATNSTLHRSVAMGPEADDETERLGIPKAGDKLELLR